MYILEYNVKGIKPFKNSQLKVSVLVIVTLFSMFTASVQAATVMPSFNLPDARNGKSVASKEFQGKALLVTFFATWCYPCLREVPDLVKLQK